MASTNDMTVEKDLSLASAEPGFEIPPNESSTLPSSVFLDLQASLSRFQHILSQPCSTDQTEEMNIVEYTQLIRDQITMIDQLDYTRDTFDMIHMAFRAYINGILPVTDQYEQILTSISSANINFYLNKLFEQDEKFARHVFFQTFDLFALPMMIDYFNGKCFDTGVHQFETIVRLILSRLQQTLEWFTFEKDDLNDQEPILRILLEFIHTSIQYDNATVKQIFNLILILTEKTILVPNFLNAGCVSYILQWLEMEALTYEIQRACIHIFYNLAQKNEGAKALNQADGLRVLKGCTSRLFDPNLSHEQFGFENMQLLYCMAMSLLIEPKENREYVKNHRPTLDYLMQAIINASQTDECSYAGFHLSRPIVVLTKLFVQDEILKYVLNEAPVRGLQASSKVILFTGLLVRFRGAQVTNDDEKDVLTLTALFNILWSISFHDEYFRDLQTDRQFLLTVKTFANDTSETSSSNLVFSHLSSILKAAGGILLNLGESITGEISACSPLSRILLIVFSSSCP